MISVLLLGATFGGLVGAAVWADRTRACAPERAELLGGPAIVDDEPVDEWVVRFP